MEKHCTSHLYSNNRRSLLEDLFKVFLYNTTTWEICIEKYASHLAKRNFGHCNRLNWRWIHDPGTKNIYKIRNQLNLLKCNSIFILNMKLTEFNQVYKKVRSTYWNDFCNDNTNSKTFSRLNLNMCIFFYRLSSDGSAIPLRWRSSLHFTSILDNKHILSFKTTGSFTKIGWSSWPASFLVFSQLFMPRCCTQIFFIYFISFNRRINYITYEHEKSVN